MSVRVRTVLRVLTSAIPLAVSWFAAQHWPQAGWLCGALGYQASVSIMLALRNQ